MDSTHLFPVPMRRPLAEAWDAGPEQFARSRPSGWCPGCGCEGVVEALAKAFAGLGAANKDILVAAGPGCANALPDSLLTYGVKAPAGLALSVGLGAKFANPDLTVVAVVGRSEALGSGCVALAGACRVNADITFIMLDDGLGAKPDERQAHAGALALAAGATFVGRAFSGEPAHAASMFLQALQHRGFSFVHLLCPCPGKDGLDASVRLRGRLRMREETASKTASSGPPVGPAAPGERSTASPGDLGAVLSACLETAPLTLGVLHEAADVPSWEESAPTVRRRGPAVRESLGLSEKEVSELEASLR
ncbi:MAG: hypothetical protein HZB91_11825 [Elusimicrobia bacterium]|nr:hypothetical protein [Elusimicrobiota bacterium]